MYLKKVEGPRAVKLPDGTVFTRADLPDKNTKRWVASRKAAVVKGLAAGLITADEAKERWMLSDDELDEWQSAIETHGERALKVTHTQQYRQP